jgi:hypothetical protein
MTTPGLMFATQLVSAAVMASVSGAPAAGAELQQKTIEAFAKYVRLTEARMDAEERGGRGFLYIDRLGSAEKAAAERQARGAAPFIAKLETRENTTRIDVPDGLVHHWVGLIFMPGVKVDDAVVLMQAYDRHAEVFAPAIVRSKLLERNGDRFRFYLRFYVKKVIGVTTDTEHDGVFGRAGPDRAYSRLHSTRVAEVENAGTSGERQKPPDTGHGFLWRLNTYWRFAQGDGGTWVQCESVTLTRDIPLMLGWIIRPFVTEIPKESLTFTLVSLRKALKAKG